MFDLNTIGEKNVTTVNKNHYNYEYDLKIESLYYNVLIASTNYNTSK